jgi:hypothetical protein
LHGNVLLREFDTLVDSADAVTDFEADIPQRAHQLLQSTLEIRVGRAGKENQQVHIGIRIQHTAAVAPDSD